MVLEKEKRGIRRFVKGQLRDEPDLSTLTLGMLKKGYLAETGRESLGSEERKFMKQVVEEELAKMQENDDSESEPEIKKPQKKRSREKEEEELESEDETESRAKRSRQSDSSSDSEDEQDCKTGSQSKKHVRSQSENKEEIAKESDHEKNIKAERPVTSDDSSDEEMNDSKKGGNESPSPEERVKKVNTAKNGEMGDINASGGEKSAASSDEESESDVDSRTEKSDKIRDGDSSASEKENGKKRNDSDSDSSSLPSLDEEKKSSPEKTKVEKRKKNKTRKTDEKSRGPKNEDKAIVRLKRYIALCGVRKNYKKLLEGCRSTRSKVAVLKKELEDLGIHGNPSIKKCKRIRFKREEAQELAELNVDNIIASEGRPKRRGTSGMQVHKELHSSYQRALNSDSDSDQEKEAPKGRQRMSDWTNLHGIISDDGDSD